MWWRSLLIYISLALYISSSYVNFLCLSTFFVLSVTFRLYQLFTHWIRRYEIHCFGSPPNKIPVKCPTCWIPTHVGVPGNEYANSLVCGQLLSEAVLFPWYIPTLTFTYLSLSSYTSGGKTCGWLLKLINFVPWSLSWPPGTSSPITIWRERALVCLQLGHTRITHSFLMV